MKNQVFKFSVLLIVMTIFGCSTEENETRIIEQKANVPITGALLYDYLNEEYDPNNNSIHEKTPSNEEESFWSFAYSDFVASSGRITGQFLIKGTDLLMVYDYHLESQDRIHVNGEWGHAKWHIKEPRVFIAERSGGNLVVKYSNWCEENRTGFFEQNLHGLINDRRDINGDVKVDLWRIGVGPKVNPNNHANAHIKTTLSDSQNSQPELYPIDGDCKSPSTMIDFDMQVQVKNGHISFKVKLDDETFEW